MIKKTLASILLLVLSLSAFSQYTNSWINYSQKYYKFPIVKNGIYRISYAQLQSAGVNIALINSPRNFQIFGRGQEVAIYVHNESSGVFSSSDYIEFYAQKNDGWYDTALYRNPNYQANKGYSFFTDTAFYYFTYNNSINNKRLQISNDNNYSSFAASLYFIYESSNYFSGTYIEGEKIRAKGANSVLLSNPEYANGEGWYDYPISLGASRTRGVSTKNVYAFGPAAQVSYEIMGASNYGGTLPNPNHHTRIEVAGITVDTLYVGYSRHKLKYNIPNSALNSNVTNIVFSSINDIGSNADRFAVPYIKIEYAHTPDLEGKSEFFMNINDASGQTKSYFDFSNFNGGSSPVFYDLDNDIRILVTKSSSNYKVLIPNSGSAKACYISSNSNIHSVTSMQPVSSNAKFTDLVTKIPNADYVIISHKSLMNNTGAFASAYDYAAYRNTVGYNSLTVDIEDLYHQFCYGIRKNPLAIRNFIKALGGTYGYSQFKGVFLIGKSYQSSRYRKNHTLFTNTLVPTMGEPPSDILILSNIIDTFYTPAIPIGRLSAKNPNHVDLYLDKIKLHEDEIHFPFDMWMKKILHFSGGSYAGEQSQIATILNDFKNIAEDTLFGGNVYTFTKTTTDPIQVNLSDQIKTHVNNGVCLLTFFGHAAGIGFDISIDDPNEYSNYGKYPLLLANSCNAGDIFQTSGISVNSSEEFVLVKDKGMIGYIASVTPATIPQLKPYSREFYRGFSAKYYGKPLGFIMQQVISKIQDSTGNKKLVCLEMTLHGDPLIRFRGMDLPDYDIKASSIYYSPEIVTTATDSFDVNIVIKNIGRAVNDSMFVELFRSYADGDSLDKYSVQIASPKFIDTISVRMPVNRAYGVGENKITVIIDSYNEIPEIEDNTNNKVVVKLNIKSADLQPVYPDDFSIVSKSKIRLKASTYYPFSPVFNYVFEIDTTDYFNSPTKVSIKINSKGGVIEWELPFTLVDSTVYYWRVSLDSNSQHGFNWRKSSFEYINGTTGWSQAHFLQFRNDDYQFTKFVENERSYKFVNDIKVIKAKTGILPYIPFYEIKLKVNNSLENYACCIDAPTGGLKIFVINEVSAKLWKAKNIGNFMGSFGNLQCKLYDVPSFDFPTMDADLSSRGLGIVPDTVWFRRIANFLGTVPDGHKVLIMSYNNAKPQLWPEYLYKAFDTIGSSYIRNYPNNRPFISFGKKGSFGTSHELVGASDTTILLFVDSVKTNWTEGKIATPIIGPSLKWSSLHWHQHSLDNPLLDSVRLQLVGITANGVETVLINGLSPDNADVVALNNLMPANIYPYCKLIAYMKDDSLRTPAYLDNWRIAYQPAPETAIDPLTHFDFYADTLMQGDSLNLEIAYRNISNVDMDSLLVKAWIRNAYGDLIPVRYKRLQPLLKNDTIIDKIKVATDNLLGQCFLFIEINPIDTATGVYDQLERTHDNNKGDIPFFVQRDKQNPLLDVTFDGIHILNNDIVSARPEVRINLRDESKFIAINDTASFKLKIKKKTESKYRKINFNNKDNSLEFIPAQLPENSAEVIYRPELEDGEYQLLVFAKDASQNKASENAYKIDFVVINKSTITQLMNWPNPFSDKTHFVFTLTGSVLPDYMKIQIMTVTGKVVREIDMTELGNIHIGRNITEYAWDGKDDFGDQLANGVYLYRVTTRLNGENIEHRESGADKYFTKNFGKMYLMR